MKALNLVWVDDDGSQNYIDITFRDGKPELLDTGLENIAELQKVLVTSIAALKKTTIMSFVLVEPRFLKDS